MLRKGIALAAFGLTVLAAPAALANAGAAPVREAEFSFEGPLGTFDQAQLQRGYKVYREVCASCHSMNLLSFRNLGEKGGPFFDPEIKNPNDNPFVKSIAKDYQINDLDSETGDVVQRPGTPADRFPDPFPNEAAARASNGGALPPDLSVISKARHHGAHYLYSLLTGFKEPPAGLKISANQYYNPWFPGDLTSAWSGDPAHVPAGGLIAMAPPLAADKVTYDDGTPSTVENQAKDVAAFLTWASEPTATARKQFGLAAMIYLLIFSGLLYASYRRIWRNVAH